MQRTLGVIVSEPEFTEFTEITEDEPGAADRVESLETVGGGFSHRTKRKIAIAAAAVAVLAATSLILRANHIFGPSPYSRTVPVGSIAWRETLPGAGVGMWTTTDSVVVATVNGLTAYSLSHGEKLWSWAAPQGQGLCAMSPTAPQGRGVVALGSLDAPSPEPSGAELCTTVQAIDVNSGKSAWPAPVGLAQDDGSVGGYAVMKELSISDGFVIAPYGQNGLISLDAATGTRLWTSDQLPGQPTSGPGSCPDQTAQTLDGEVYTIVANGCPTAGASTPTVAVYSAAKIGEPQVIPLPTGSPQCSANARTLFATAADVLVTCTTFNGQSFPAYAIPPGAAHLVALPLQRIGGIAPADVADNARQLELTGGFVSGHDLIVESTGPDSAAALTGVDLSTGLPLWQDTIPAGSRFHPLGPSADKAQGVQTAGADWTLLSISPTTGATTTVPLDSAALADSGINGSFDYAAVGSYMVTGEFGATTTVVASTD